MISYNSVRCRGGDRLPLKAPDKGGYRVHAHVEFNLMSGSYRSYLWLLQIASYLFLKRTLSSPGYLDHAHTSKAFYRGQLQLGNGRATKRIRPSRHMWIHLTATSKPRHAGILSTSQVPQGLEHAGPYCLAHTMIALTLARDFKASTLYPGSLTFR